ncbi:MAG: TRL-like family protein [Planctomycetota bacterium]|jgi:hypothetical protein
MKKLVVLMVLGFGISAIAGCAANPYYGFFFTDNKAPNIFFDCAGQNVGDKVGKAEVKNILGLVSWGDASIGAAAKAGQIKKINYIDVENFSIFGFFAKQTTIVGGE